jgi:hypothetical protein
MKNSRRIQSTPSVKMEGSVTFGMNAWCLDPSTNPESITPDASNIARGSKRAPNCMTETNSTYLRTNPNALSLFPMLVT